MSYCACPSPDGFYCILSHGHEGLHLSLDNRALWKGTPGKPVTWGEEAVEEPVAEDRQTKRAKALARGFTGEFCSNCGSANMRRAGTCMVCEGCGTTTGCS